MRLRLAEIALVLRRSSPSAALPTPVEIAPVEIAPVVEVAPVEIAPVAPVAPVIEVAPVAPVEVAPVAPVEVAHDEKPARGERAGGGRERERWRR